MTDYYVRTSGNDAAAGTSAAAAWATFGKAMTSVSAGDTIWVGAGVYRVSSTVAPSSMASMTYLYGDTDGSKTGDAGEVVLTNYGTNDSTAPNGIVCLTFASKSNWTIGRITVKSGAANWAVTMSGTSANLTFQDMTIQGYSNSIVSITTTWGTAQNFIIERCRMLSLAADCIYIEAPTSATGSDTNANILIRNCVLIGAGGVKVANSGTSAKRTSGITIANCYILALNASGGAGCVYTTATLSTTYKVSTYNSLLVGTYGTLAVAASMQQEDYNVFECVTPRSNVSAGANSLSDFSRNSRHSLSHESSFGAPIRSFGDLVAGSPLLGWGTSASVTVTDDIEGVTRPASGAGTTSKAIGPLEHPNSGVMEQVMYRTALPSVRIAGPGYHDFPLAVRSNTTTTVSAWMRYDSLYGVPPKPALYIVNGGEAGVAVTSNVMTGAANTWEQVSASFAATSNGVVTVRAISYSSNGPGSLYFDDMQASES